MRLRKAPANPGAEMSILEHIAELRDRLVKSCIALTVTTLVAAFVLYNRTFTWITQSYCDIDPKYRIETADGRGCGLLAQSPLEGIGIRIRVSLVLGLVLALPVVAYQLWRFITPGLKQNEKRYAIPFALASTLLFAGGVALAFYTMPKAIGFLAAAGGPGLINFYAAGKYLRFVLFMGLAFGLTFEFPLVLVFLSMVGALSSQAMLKAWRPAVAIIIVVAAVVTPSQDPISLLAMALPMWVFYFAAAAVAKFIIEPRRRRRAQALQGS
ncbi:MAG TPA: twin-arginine translocase subunit TatC [Actinomycetes bacterium]|jgi:sec-independent protein translocase protein TatC|nr:twin-arginine translocase subunit TatC [Actinomycetes bacterium]